MSPGTVCLLLWVVASADARDAHGLWHRIERRDARSLAAEPLDVREPMEFGRPVNVGEVNTGASETLGFITPDGLTLVFDSNREGTVGMEDIFVATRPDRSSSFGGAVPLPGGVNSPIAELQPTMTEDGLEIFFVRNAMNEWKHNEIYRAARASRSAPFGGASPVTELNVAGVADAYPWISSDGLTIYFSSNRAGSSSDDIWHANREDRGARFREPQRLAEVNSDGPDVAFSLRADGLVGYLASSRRPTSPYLDIYETRRESTAARFATPRLVRWVSSPRFESGPSVVADGSELYFFADASLGGKGDYDIWRSIVEPYVKEDFVRGDANGDGEFNLSDTIAMLHYLLGGADLIPCKLSADATNDDDIDMSDAAFLLRFLFVGGRVPDQPFPECGVDPEDAQSLFCEIYEPCNTSLAPR